MSEQIPRVDADALAGGTPAAEPALDQIPAGREAPEPPVPEESRSHRVLREIASGSALLSVCAIIVALVVGGVFIAVTNQQVQAALGYFFARPGDTFAAIGNAVGGAYSALFQGAVYNVNAPDVATGIQSLSTTLTFATPLIAAGLGVALSFRVGLFNIGGQGQMLIAALFAGIVGFKLPMAPGVHLLIAVIAGLVGGAIWAAVAGVLKAYTRAHEVIVTIMLNYIALNLLNYLLTTSFLRAPGANDPRTPATLPTAVFPKLFGSGYSLDIGILLAILATVAVWWLLERSNLGFRFRAVGENPNAARVAGMSVTSVYVWAMVISGALVGLAGATQVLGQITTGFGSDIDAGIGFSAITVALLGRSRPFGVLVAGILIGAFQAGGFAMQAADNVPVEVIAIIQSVTVLFIAAPPLVRAIFRLPAPGAPSRTRRASRTKGTVAR
ncbi:ABC transporter permease [Leifsonia xyli subsp. cynodontis DSM 46306]|uniref:ABC transporter permease n=1 Tax=Leifsonia xyli subsp. cynodontis DSM 46306 TaxID=1389489 RepID=U3P2W4_LEIXC|nr:ABC transporter permease [Leifsonia xyli]AGW40665.1 ABC transporter permease [Leifsonia xyli subsp. cynodontis DSM 46306]